MATPTPLVPTYAEVLKNPKQFSASEVVNAALIASTKDGELDNGALASKLQALGKEAARHDPDYNFAAKQGRAKDIVENWVKTYNIAARESLNLIPLTTAQEIALAFNLGFQPTHGLVCSKAENVDFSNLNNTLRANHVVCKTVPARTTADRTK